MMTESIIKWKNPVTEIPEINSSVIIWDGELDLYSAYYCINDDEEPCYYVYLGINMEKEFFASDFKYWCYKKELLKLIKKE